MREVRLRVGSLTKLDCFTITDENFLSRYRYHLSVPNWQILIDFEYAIDFQVFVKTLGTSVL